MTARSTPRGESGFVLVGVIVFVLALTILGLSLFSLSSYEAKFLGDSQDASQAYLDASAGLARARFALTATSTLASARTNLPPNVIYSRAMRVEDGDSSGVIDWARDHRPIEVRAIAKVGRVQQMLTAQFIPSTVPDYYKRLLTAAGPIVVAKEGSSGRFNPAPNRSEQTFLNGEAWQNDRDTTWALDAQGIHPLLPRLGVAYPEVTAFQAQHWAGARLISAAPDGIYSLNEITSRFYRTEAGGGEPYSLYDKTASPVINVTGTVVWMADRGIRFKNKVRVNGLPTSRLIIVAKPSPGGDEDLDDEDKQTGVWFFGGLEAPSVPVLLVSDGRVAIEAFEGFNQNSAVTYLSVFAQRIRIMGPIPGHAMTLNHPISLLPDVVDELYTLGVLPNTSVGSGPTLTFSQGSWSQDP